MNKTLLWTLVVGGLLIMVFGLAKLSSGPGVVGGSLPLAVSSEDNYKGAENGKAVLVEYSDFQCPGCAGVYPVIKQLVNEFPNDLKFVYRHYPLRQMHNNAVSAAQASEAAGKQGKFWEMHDMIFNTQSTWENDPAPEILFEKLAESLGLDLDQFESDFSSEGVRDKVQRDEDSASSLSGTPTFFLNGKQITNPGSYDGFKALIEEAINN